MTRIVISEFMDEHAVNELRQGFDVVYDPTLVDEPQRLLVNVANADALIVRNRTQVRGKLLEGMIKTRVIGRLGVGLDNIDLAACKKLGMQVIPATGANALAVAEYVIGTAMLLLRGAYGRTAEVAAGKWPRTALSSGREINGKTLGLVGFGSIGQLTAQLARGLGMKLTAFDPLLSAEAPVWVASAVQCVSMDELLLQADVVSLHVPLTPETQNLLSADRVARMKPGGIVINTSRGGIVDEAAIAAALRNDRLGGAAFDVFESEPLPSDNPWVGCPNTVLTPHIAGVSTEANERVSAMIAASVRQALESSSSC